MEPAIRTEYRWTEWQGWTGWMQRTVWSFPYLELAGPWVYSRGPQA